MEFERKLSCDIYHWLDMSNLNIQFKSVLWQLTPLHQVHLFGYFQRTNTNMYRGTGLHFSVGHFVMNEKIHLRSQLLQIEQGQGRNQSSVCIISSNFLILIIVQLQPVYNTPACFRVFLTLWKKIFLQKVKI